MDKYIPRIADEILARKLKSSSAVLITGPKWCGKSTTAMQKAGSVVKLQDPMDRDYNIAMARAFPSKFLEGETPRLIDEWQDVPSLWDSIRSESDIRDKFGQFILTGSVIIKDESNVIRHSGTGRIARMKMSTMSQYEIGNSSGEVSLSDLFNHPNSFVDGSNEYDLEDMARIICRGGWPKSIGVDDEVAYDIVDNYYSSLIEEDILRIDNIRRSPDVCSRILRSYARNISSMASIMTIQKDSERSSSSPSWNTISSYVDALKRLFVIDNMPAWNPSIRSKTAIQSSDTLHFADTSVAISALGLSPNRLLNDLNTFGLIFEDFCVHELRCYAEPLNGKVSHYRDNLGLEADAVVHLKDGRWAPIEIKLFDPDRINEGAKNLKKLVNRIDTSKMNEPSFMMVITAGRKAFRREDGVYICPITCLRP